MAEWMTARQAHAYLKALGIDVHLRTVYKALKSGRVKNELESSNVRYTRYGTACCHVRRAFAHLEGGFNER